MALLASEFDQSKYLKAEAESRERKFRIAEATTETFDNDGRSEKKLVLSFTNSNQCLVLNKTNNRTIRGAFGDDTAGWKNKVIVVFPTTTEMRGKIVPCLRVRIPPPKQTATEAAPAPQQPQPAGNSPTGNGAAPIAAAAAIGAAVGAAVVGATAAAAADPELEPDPVKPLGDDLEDEIPF